ncbi:hypothetical protein BEL05_04910 [Shewanella colwelliana]|uniref:Uncharacterized protein n=1 Tax=Shewanella colwelliana TaxID=23 RepID=A0A1E5IP76_SHECO|nr:major capsid protein P2 [Shewanella colwelliana]OEG72319.1 hypothetical protein BEL05_04910 [Shewanella colwelliana]
MARTLKTISTISAVVAGALVTITLPLGATYDQVLLGYTGVTLAQIKNIRVKVNNDVIQEFADGQALADFNKYYKRNSVAGLLDFYFKQPEMKTLAEQRMFGLGTANGMPKTPEQVPLMPAVTSATITFEIDAGAAAPNITCSAIQSDPAPLGNIIKFKRFPLSLNAGTNVIDNIPKGFDARIKAIHIVTAATVEKIVTKVDGTEIAELKQTIVEKIQVDNGRAPQADIYTTDYVMEGDMKQSISLLNVRDLRFHVECAAGTGASTYGEAVVEYIDTLKGA